MTGPAEPLPLALYVHVPWCVRKCPYCDFNSHAFDGDLPQADYVRALLADLDQDLTQDGVAGRPLVSVFIGGGTPSLLAPGVVAGLLEGIAGRVPLAPGCEITLEANPGTVEAARFDGFRAAGVNRLSLGVQSFDDGALRALGRIHDARDARRAVEQALGAGFDAVNLDLMFGLPGQRVRDALADVEAALALGPLHLSHYQLTIEPNTRFHHRPPPLPGEEVVWDMQRRCAERIEAGGYAHYEVSAHARPGGRCTHNLNYWRFGDYLGIGAGAHAKLSVPGGGGVRRSTRHRHPRRYLQAARDGDFVASRRVLDDRELCFEFFLNALRLTEGFDPGLFPRATGLDLPAASLSAAVERGLLKRSEERIRPTRLGRCFLDDLVGIFLPA